MTPETETKTKCKHEWDKDYCYAIRQCLCCGGMQQSQKLIWGDVFVQGKRVTPTKQETGQKE
jgi:hypothetical protein